MTRDVATRAVASAGPSLEVAVELDDVDVDRVRRRSHDEVVVVVAKHARTHETSLRRLGDRSSARRRSRWRGDVGEDQSERVGAGVDRRRCASPRDVTPQILMKTARR